MIFNYLKNESDMIYCSRYGVLAQLGAHHTGSVGVRGSNPLCSTIKTADFSRFIHYRR